MQPSLLGVSNDSTVSLMAHFDLEHPQLPLLMALTPSAQSPALKQPSQQQNSTTCNNACSHMSLQSCTFSAFSPVRKPGERADEIKATTRETVVGVQVKLGCRVCCIVTACSTQIESRQR